MGKLTAMGVKNLTEPGRYSDGEGLILKLAAKGNPRRHLSDMTLLKILRDKGHDYTVHGFRSSFRDWVAEKTNYPGEVAEAALAHTITNKVEAAYRRTDYLDKRKPMMADWANFVAR